MCAMLGSERARAALLRREPDRVPVFELLVDRHIIAQVVSSGDYGDFAEAVGFDLVLTDTPSRLYRETPVDPARGLYRNEWGVVRQYGAQIVSMPKEGPIKRPEDLDRYAPPSPDDPMRYEELGRLLARFKGRTLVGIHLHDVFNYPYYLRGMQQLFLDMYDRPEIVHRLVRISVDHDLAIARRAVRMGADFVLLGDDFGAGSGPLVSPAHFREFFLDGFREIVQGIKDTGAFVVKHCCGNITSLLPMLVDAGIDALHPLDAAAGMDIAAVKRDYGDRICVIGGIDCGDPLSNWPVDRLERLVEETVARLAPGGGWILSSSNTLHRSVKVENYLAMVRTARKWRYPAAA